MWSVPKCVRFLVLCILHNQCPDTLPAPDYPDICVLSLLLTPFNFCCCCYFCCCYLIGRRVALQSYKTKWIGCHCCCLVAHSCPSLWDPRNCRPPVSSLSLLLSWDFPARSLEWVAASSFRVYSMCSVSILVAAAIWRFADIVGVFTVGILLKLQYFFPSGFSRVWKRDQW